MCYVDSISYSRLGGCPYRCTVRCPCPVAPEQQPELAEAGKPGSWTFSFPIEGGLCVTVGRRRRAASNFKHSLLTTELHHQLFQLSGIAF